MTDAGRSIRGSARSSTRSALLLALALAGCKEQGTGADQAPPELKVMAAASEPDPSTPLYLEGQKLFVEGKFDEAVDHYRRGILLKPSAKLYHAMGDSLYAQQKFRDASEAYREAVKLDPEKWFSWSRLGRSLIESGRPAEGAQAFRKVQSLKPGESAAFRDEAEALLWSKEYDAAVERMNQAMALDPSNKASDLKLIGEIHLKRERFADAIEALKKSAELHSDAQILADIAAAYLQLGQMKEALTYYERSAKEDSSSDPVPWELVGALRQRLGDEAGAREAYSASLSKKDRPSPHVALGRLALAKKDRELAKREFDAAMNAAIELSAKPAKGGAPQPDGSEQLRELARFASELKETKIAVQLLEVAAKEQEVLKEAKRPADGTIFVELAGARVAAGDVKGAKLACDKAKEFLGADAAKVTCPPKP